MFGKKKKKNMSRGMAVEKPWKGLQMPWKGLKKAWNGLNKAWKGLNKVWKGSPNKKNVIFGVLLGTLCGITEHTK